MLDLDLNDVSDDSFHRSSSKAVVPGMFLELSRNQMEDSAASFNSSVVNADALSNTTTADDDDSSVHRVPCGTSVAYGFDFFKKTEDRDNESSGGLTRQFFPMTAGAEGDASSGSSLLHPRVLQVSSGGPLPPEQPQQHQPVKKKSRRGPRSRSSQYRGVTFYRRTGRWESHIWFVYIV